MYEINPQSYGECYDCSECESDGKKHYPTVYIHNMPKALIEGHEVSGDKKVCVVLYGTISELAMRDRGEDGEDNHSSLDVRVERAGIVTEEDKEASVWDEMIDTKG